ncbi:MAG: restriction endonuclease subunit S [Actinomycetaceae bacterium]|nr:restriction endonuclease subunit S [Actinomycetaceae bacterium]
MARRRALPLIEDFDSIPEEALVPVEEQPYEIPQTWRWVRLGSVSQINPPKPRSTALPDVLEVPFIPMASVSDRTGTVSEIEFRPLHKVSKGFTYFGSGDVLFAKITPSMENGKSAVVPELPDNLGFGSTEFYVLRPVKEVLNANYLHIFLRQKKYRDVARQAMTGAVGQQRVPRPFLENTPFPLAPQVEQERIVGLLEDRLARIDEVIERSESVLEGFDKQTENLIRAAVSGHLTEDWREKHSSARNEMSLETSTDNEASSAQKRGAKKGKLPLIEDFDNIPERALVPAEEQPFKIPKTWQWVRLGSASEVFSGGTPSTKHPEYFDGDIPWITPADLGGLESMYVSNGRKSITQKGLDNSSAVLLPSGTVCLSSRAPVGHVAIAANPLATNQGMKNFIPTEVLDSQYLYYYLKASKALLESRASGTTFLELSATRASAVPLALAPLEEQVIIARILSTQTEKIEAAKSFVLDSLDRLKELRSGTISAALSGHL